VRCWLGRLERVTAIENYLACDGRGVDSTIACLFRMECGLESATDVTTGLVFHKSRETVAGMLVVDAGDKTGCMS
jgi:hypothetical protein